MWCRRVHILCGCHSYVSTSLLVFQTERIYFRSNDKYLHLGGPLLAGVTVVALSSLAPMVLPLGMRALAASEAISLYGGLAVFGGFVLYESVLKSTKLSYLNSSLLI